MRNSEQVGVVDFGIALRLLIRFLAAAKLRRACPCSPLNESKGDTRATAK